MNYFSESSLKFFLNFLSIIGIYALFWWCIENLKSIYEIIKNVLSSIWTCHPNITLQEEYGQWAVITGGTDGIGKQYAFELAKRGMNICLISRSETKLINVANEIEQKYKVSTKFIVADFSKERSIYDHIRSQLENLDIGILINNVGMLHEIPEVLDKMSEDSIWDMININIGAITFMSHIVIPGMKMRKRGLILNMSSGAASQPVPLLAVYSATKSFARSLNVALNKELAEYNIKVHMLSPYFVRTNMTNFVRLPNIVFPNAETFVRSAIKTLGKLSHTCGYWSHSIQFVISASIPEFVRIFIVHSINKKFRHDYDDRQKKTQIMGA